MERNYIAFISYRHLPLDAKVADKVHEMIERYVIPRELRKNGEKHLGIAFRDREELPLTSDLTADIYEALDHSSYLVVICTPDTPKSLWVNREIEYFISKHGRDRVLTVLAAGTMETSVPKPVTHIYGADGETIDVREPLAAVIEAPTEKKMFRLLKSEFLRLAAAMLACPYDALVQRNKKYRQQILSGVLAVVLVIACSFVGMLLMKNAQIKQQLRQTQINEAKALAYQSEQILGNGARLDAVKLALQALPSEVDDRPYVPEAEAALAKALQVYEIRNVRVNRFIDTRRTQIAFVGCEECVVVADDGGYLCCYDTNTGEERWNLSYTDYFKLSGKTDLELRLYQNNQLLLARSNQGALVLDVNTGEVLRRASWEGNVSRNIIHSYNGELTVYERLLQFGGYLDTDTNELTICDEGERLIFDQLKLSDQNLYCVNEERFAIRLPEELRFYQTSDGKLINRVFLHNTEHQEMLMNNDGSILLFELIEEETHLVTLEVCRYNEIGELLDKKMSILDVSQGKLIDTYVNDNYVLICCEYVLILMDRKTLEMKTYTHSYAYYDASVDDLGNVLMLSGNPIVRQDVEFIIEDLGNIEFRMQVNQKYLPRGSFDIAFEDGWTVTYLPVNEWDQQMKRNYELPIHYELNSSMTFFVCDNRIYVADGDAYLSQVPVLEVVGQEFASSEMVSYDMEFDALTSGEDIVEIIKEKYGAEKVWCGSDDVTIFMKNGRLYLLDLKTEANPKEIALDIPLPYDGASLFLVKNNTAVLVRTGLTEYLAMDIHAGETLGCVEIKEAGMYLQVAEDDAGEYIYIWDDFTESSKGMRVETDTWCVVAEFPMMMDYRQDRNEVCLKKYLMSGTLYEYEVLQVSVFTLEEMIAMGETLVNKQS